MVSPKLIYLGVKGSVIAVNSATGEPAWAQSLKGGDFVNVALDGDRLFAATHGEIFCLDPRTGAIRWHNPLKGYGWGLISIAGAGIAANSLPLLIEKRRRDEESASAASSSSAT